MINPNYTTIHRSFLGNYRYDLANNGFCLEVKQTYVCITWYNIHHGFQFPSQTLDDGSPLSPNVLTLDQDNLPYHCFSSSPCYVYTYLTSELLVFPRITSNTIGVTTTIVNLNLDFLFLADNCLVIASY